MERMLKRIYKFSLLFLVLSAAISSFFTEWRFPLSILVGGFIGLGNLKGIVMSVSRIFEIERSDFKRDQVSVIEPRKAQARMLILGIFRLLIIFSILLILAILNAINIYGFLIGFSIVFVIIIKEGLIASKGQS
jgi:hypothetical protein